MARIIIRLNTRTVDALCKTGRHADGGNLYLIVDAPNTKDGPKSKPAKRGAFIFRWDGKLWVRCLTSQSGCAGRPMTGRSTGLKRSKRDQRRRHRNALSGGGISAAQIEFPVVQQIEARVEAN